MLRYRSLLWRTTLVELRTMYAGSLLGLFWVLVGPVLMFTLYALTYAVIFRIRPADMTTSEYVIYVFCGLVPFLAFAQSLSAGTMSLSSNRAHLLNTVFPAELIPLRSVIVASASMPAGALILLFGDLLFSRLSMTFLLVPVVMVLLVMFTAGVCWMLSLVALLVRDIQQLLYYITMMLLIVTPIAYTPSMIPPQLTIIMYLNPLFYYTAAIQSLVIHDQIPSLPVILGSLLLSFSSFGLGYAVCVRGKQVFYDYA